MKIGATLLTLMVCFSTLTAAAWVETEVTKHCLTVPQTEATCSFSTEWIEKSADNEYVEFDFNMPEGGTHELKVFAECFGDLTTITLGVDGADFILSNNEKGDTGGTQCLRLNERIDATVNDCQNFKVVFEGTGEENEQCVENIQFKSTCTEEDG